MDTKKIGLFLKELRLQQSMTQEQLGEKIGVTNKTVSRWENGNYMPPIESLKQISELYRISINEIISGKRLSDEDYKQEADGNIATAFEEIEAKNKRFEGIMLVVMGITTVLTIAVMLLLPNGENLSGIEKTKEVLVVLLVLVIAIISNTLNMVAVSLRKMK